MSGKPDRVTFEARMNVILTELRKEIISGIRPQGSYLPSETVLGEQYRMSKKSVRKALEFLVDEGLIVKIPRVGNQVSIREKDPLAVIRMGVYPSIEEQGVLAGLLERFGRTYPNVRVETVTLPYSRYPSSVKGFLDEGFLDVFTLNNRNFADLEHSDHLHMLEERLPNPELHPFLYERFRAGGKLYATPFQFSPVVLCYNKDLFKRSGLKEPHSGWSWKELLDCAVAIKEKTGVYGFYAHIESLNRFPIFLLQARYRFLRDDDGGYRFHDPALWDILKDCRRLLHGQGVPPAFLSEGDAGAETLFKEQKTGMIMTTYYGLQLLKSVSFAYDISPLPFGRLPKTLLLVTGLAVNRQSKQKESARLLVDFLTGPSAQHELQRLSLAPSAHSGAADEAEEETKDGPSRYRLYREIVPAFADYKELDISIEALDAFSQELKLFWAGLEEPEAVIGRLRG
ncbi:extracellular solute-binding protein [Paenibacillus sp.]|uniref:extracellular solute-binding protein n=1 Tax=Paenibacillus sp. TaxID=58172 RepID=UPI002810E359|nr:extracellular solute-binding protein [Paenibacillus sp.]